MNYLKVFGDGLQMANAVVSEYLNPDTPSYKDAVTNSVTNVLVDLGVRPENAPEIALDVAHVIEAAGGGQEGADNLLNDFSSIIHKHGVNLPPFALMLLGTLLNQAIAAVRSKLGGGK